MAHSVPFATMSDAVGQKVTIELANGDEYTGTLEGVDARTLNVRLAVVLVRRKDGAYDAMGRVVVPGAQVKLVVLPSLMRNAPFFADVCSGAAWAKRKAKKGKAGKKHA